MDCTPIKKKWEPSGCTPLHPMANVSYRREYHYGKKRAFSTSLVKFLVFCVCFVLSEYQTFSDSESKEGRTRKAIFSKKTCPMTPIPSNNCAVQCSESVKQTKNIYNLSYRNRRLWVFIFGKTRRKRGRTEEEEYLLWPTGRLVGC